MEDHPLVSIIIPNYNHCQFLEERIKSILNQTYTNYEIIILDDNSSDHSLEIINKFTENPHIVNIVINEKNSGKPCRQWRKGIQMANGDLIWIAESDDSCSPFFLERLIPIHCSNHVVLTFCRSQRFDEKGHMSFTFNFEFKDGIWDGHEFIDKYLGRRCVIANASSVIFSKKCFQNIPEDYLNLEGSNDWLFWIELCRQGKIAFSGEALNYFRYHQSNTTIKNGQNGINDFADKQIIDYLFSQSLIKKSTYKQLIRYRLIDLSSRKFESETIRKELIKVWGGYSVSYKIKNFISKVLVKLEYMIWE